MSLRFNSTFLYPYPGKEDSWPLSRAQTPCQCLPFSTFNTKLDFSFGNVSLFLLPVLAVDCSCFSTRSQQLNAASRRPSLQQTSSDCCSVWCFQPERQLKSIHICHSLTKACSFQVTCVQWYNKISCILPETYDI